MNFSEGVQLEAGFAIGFVVVELAALAIVGAGYLSIKAAIEYWR